MFENLNALEIYGFQIMQNSYATWGYLACKKCSTMREFSDDEGQESVKNSLKAHRAICDLGKSQN